MLHAAWQALLLPREAEFWETSAGEVVPLRLPEDRVERSNTKVTLKPTTPSSKLMDMVEHLLSTSSRVRGNTGIHYLHSSLDIWEKYLLSSPM